jgi:serine/threonine protein kinase
MGSVFKAIDLSMNRLVAIKFLPLNLAKDRLYIRRFLREAKSAAQLAHPNITRVYEVASYKGIFYFSMEYVDGSTLLALIDSEQAVDIQTAIDIIIQAARGLEHAHSNNIIHRDIKPENIMITKDGTVKICDMGLAKRIGAAEHDITLTGFVIGTPSYMSPEQITNPKSLDNRTDIYSLGATFYHAVTRERPFLGATSAQTMLNVVRENLNFPKTAKIPAQIVKVIKKMMAKDPAKRFQNAQELISELTILKKTLHGTHTSRWFRPRPKTDPNSPSPPLNAAGTLEKRSRLRLLLLIALAILLAAFLPKAIWSVGIAIQKHPVAQIKIPPPTASVQEHMNAGLAFASLRLWQEALEEFTLITQANPLIPAGWNQRGWALHALGKFDESLESFNEALRLSPQDPEIHRNRGAVLLSMKKLEEALDEFEIAVSLSPENASNWFAKSQCLKEMGRQEESNEALAQAQKLSPK